jgi:hypothetical protein
MIRAEEAYYVCVFGSQCVSVDPDGAHSFAVFVRATWDCRAPGSCRLEAHSISWLSARMCSRALTLLPECGHNFDFHTTLRYVLENDERVSVWGPYRIHPDLYCRALDQIRLLESGQVKYKSIDTGHPSDRVCNCIHALSSVVDGHRVCVLSPSWGETASYNVTKRYGPWILDGGRTHDWVAYALRLNCYPIVYRDWEHPRSGVLRGPISRALCRDRDATPTYGPPPR